MGGIKDNHTYRVSSFSKKKEKKDIFLIQLNIDRTGAFFYNKNLKGCIQIISVFYFFFSVEYLFI